jgi:two-component system sensor histidine kinase KdpD
VSGIASPTSADARRRATLRALAAWLVVAVLVSAVLHELRPQLDKAHMALVYVLVVLLASARDGRIVGLALSVVCFLAFNFLLLPPFYTFIIADPRDWLVLAAFLLTGSVAAQLLHRAQRGTEEARRRATELTRLGELGAQTLAAPRADDAATAIARVMNEELGVEGCDIFAYDDASGTLRRIAHARRVRPLSAREVTQPAVPTELPWLRPAIERGVVVFQRLDGTAHLRPAGEDPGDSLLQASEARVVVLPLRVRDRVVGVVQLTGDRGIRISRDAARLATPLAYYAALGVERSRLSAQAERAEAFREADRLKDALLATVSHDLRTPLTTIKALASEIRRDGDDRAATIELEADRLNRMVADLLDLSRARAGALPLHVEPNAVDDLVGAALQQLAGVPGAERIRVHLENGGDIVMGRFDFVLALRALVNLLENALKYSPADAPVDLRVCADPPHLRLEVEDRGPGVPPADVERIFDAFHRGTAGTADAGEGTGRGAGLGLAIARSLAEAQGGSVTYTPRPGGGSRFTLLLPHSAAPSDAGS